MILVLDATLLLQLHFNSFPDARLVPIELIMDKIAVAAAGLYWVAARGATHFPQWAGVFSFKKTFF